MRIITKIFKFFPNNEICLFGLCFSLWEKDQAITKELVEELTKQDIVLVGKNWGKGRLHYVSNQKQSR